MCRETVCGVDARETKKQDLDTVSGDSTTVGKASGKHRRRFVLSFLPHLSSVTWPVPATPPAATGGAMSADFEMKASEGDPGQLGLFSVICSWCSQ